MTVLFLGPLPPPVNGFAAINAAMLERLRAVTTVFVFDRSPGTLGRGWLRHARLGARTLLHLFRFGWVLITQRPTSLYVGFSGGFGQMIDLPFLLLARAASLSIFLHHHSFAYMHRRWRRTHVCFSIVPDAVHIILCGAMEKCLKQVYFIPAENIYELSNASFMAARPTATSWDRHDTSTRVGFFSNISSDKGIFEFLDVTLLARDVVPGLQTIIAGPVDPGIRNRFFEILGQRPDIRYLGAVHGPEKEAFYASIDLLLFPSSYVNEAEPLTIVEALAGGVGVLATNIGCIPGMIPNACGRSVSREEFGSLAVAMILKISKASPDELRDIRRAITEKSFQTWTANFKRLSRVVANITGVASQPFVS